MQCAAQVLPDCTLHRTSVSNSVSEGHGRIGVPGLLGERLIDDPPLFGLKHRAPVGWPMPFRFLRLHLVVCRSANGLASVDTQETCLSEHRQ